MKTKQTMLILAACTLLGAGCDSSNKASSQKPSQSESISSKTELASSESIASSQKPSLEPMPEGKQVGSFDQTPIPAFDQGWLCVEDGKAGLLGTDGSWKVDPLYDFVTIVIGSSVNPADQTISPPIMMSDSTGANPPLSISSDGIKQEMPGGLGGANPNNYCLNDQGQVILEQFGTGTFDASSEEFKSMLPDQTIRIFKQSELSTANTSQAADSYSLWNPQTGDLFGPYKQDETPAFGIQKQVSPIHLYNTLNSNTPVNGPFYVREDDGMYTVYSADCSKSLGGFEAAYPCAINSITVLKDGRSVVLDGSLNEIYSVRADSSSLPVGSFSLVLEGDQWLLISSDQ